MGDDESIFASMCPCCLGDNGEPVVVRRKEQWQTTDERTPLLSERDLVQTPAASPDEQVQSSPSCTDVEDIIEVVNCIRIHFEIVGAEHF